VTAAGESSSGLEALPVGFTPEAAISAPLLLWTDERTGVLLFNAVRPDGRDFGRPPHVGTGILEFLELEAVRFIDQPDPGSSGTSDVSVVRGEWGIFEVAGSSWAREGRGRHYAVTFHEVIVECLAGEVRASSADGPRMEIAAGFLQSMLR